MRALHEIISAYELAVAKGKRTALATVVHVEGSSYRRPGARMLVDDEGNITGAISGGCLEGDALKKALLVIAKQEAKLVTYDTSNETDMSIGIQLGCEGVIQVLFEPINEQLENNPIDILRKAVQQTSSVIATYFDLKNKNKHQLGTCLFFDGNKFEVSHHASGSFNDFLNQDIKETYNNQSTQFIAYQQSAESISAFLEYITAPIQLIVVGAGNDAIPLIKIANILGWNTLVIDGRDAYAKQERFEASCQVMLMKPEELMEKVKINDHTAFVLVTHNYNYDKAILKHLLPIKPPYIGMLGPKKKLNRMLDDLRNQGMSITDEMMENVYGPTGLDIGAESPDEIALSIIAEIQAVMQGKQGGLLRAKTEVIHDRERNIFRTKLLPGEK